MQSDNHLAKFKTFAENQVKHFESKQVLTEKEKEFLAQQRAYIANFDLILAEKQYQILSEKIEILTKEITALNWLPDSRKDFHSLMGIKQTDFLKTIKSIQFLENQIINFGLGFCEKHGLIFDKNLLEIIRCKIDFINTSIEAIKNLVKQSN